MMLENKKILIVDDDEIFLRLAEHDLTSAGYIVFKARGGKEAIALAKDRRPHLVLLDINLPQMDGGEIGHILKNTEETKTIPLIYLTSLMTKKEEAESGNIISGNFFIAKPYNVKQLLQEIKKRLSPPQR